MRRGIYLSLVIALLLALAGCDSGFKKANDIESELFSQEPASIVHEPARDEEPDTGLDPDFRLQSVEYYEAGLDDRILSRQFYEYDDRGRLIRLWSPEGYLTRVSDAHHFWTFLLDADITDDPYAVEEDYEYDDENRLIKITGIGPEETHEDERVSYTVTLDYDSSGQLFRESFQGRSFPQITAELTYRDGFLKSVKTVSDYPEFPFRLDYDYDDQGRVTTVFFWIVYENSLDRLEMYLYQYDTDTGFLWRRSKANDSDGWNSWETYQYDNSGRLSSITREWAESYKRPVQTWVFSA